MAAADLGNQPHLTEKEASVPEVNLHTFKECFVYKIPPLKNESGHRANDWDVNKWLWSGRLRIAARDAKLTIYLEDAQTGALFAECPVNEPGTGATSVEPVTDSSRYFVLRVEDGKGHHQYIGMGFRERPDAYDFNATLVDHWRSVRREREAEEVHRLVEEKGEAAAVPMADLSLKEGQTLHINIGLGQKKREKPRSTSGGSGELKPLAPPPTLAPPPPASPGMAATDPARGVEEGASHAAPPARPSIERVASDEFGDFSAPGDGGDDFDDFVQAAPAAAAED